MSVLAWVLLAVAAWLLVSVVVALVVGRVIRHRDRQVPASRSEAQRHDGDVPHPRDGAVGDVPGRASGSRRR